MVVLGGRPVRGMPEPEESVQTAFHCTELGYEKLNIWDYTQCWLGQNNSLVKIVGHFSDFGMPCGYVIEHPKNWDVRETFEFFKWVLTEKETEEQYKLCGRI